MSHTFNVLFWLQNYKLNNDTGKVPVSVRITVDGKRAEIATGKKVPADKWNSSSGLMRGQSVEARSINKHLRDIDYRLHEIYDELERNGEYVSAQAIKSVFQGKNIKQHSVIELFKYHNNQIKSQLGKGYSKGTLERYQTTLKHTLGFIQHHYKADDFLFRDMKFSFITEFEFYLKAVCGIGHNTVVKYLRNFKKIILIAVKNDYLSRDPFVGYKMSLKEVKKDYLTKDEIEALVNKEFTIDRLEHIRDIFLFCCYTGLAYADVKRLTAANISIGLDGEYWIFINRKKTGSESNVPLLQPAVDIIEKYEDCPITSHSGYLLPVISNQKMNAYLKEVGTLCGINKTITFHMARHTFATTVTLANGVSIETVSSMLGHKNIRTTQIYAKVVQEKVSADMRKLKSLMSKSN
ncbi:site-specific integrase [Fulvivirga maritima]|uniref:site-specific integrase n=1 Tax=Fulvivirga maritima TaxID=2904247 RepID=UPI001F19B44C|nr:site-specific integrase [Fulvivirga maritima]UII28754.1 site-specific integrase [Fulvivirga maritima]